MADRSQNPFLVIVHCKQNLAHSVKNWQVPCSARFTHQFFFSPFLTKEPFRGLLLDGRYFRKLYGN